jgi:hypothetical protein
MSGGKIYVFGQLRRRCSDYIFIPITKRATSGSVRLQTLYLRVFIAVRQAREKGDD